MDQQAIQPDWKLPLATDNAQRQQGKIEEARAELAVLRQMGVLSELSRGLQSHLDKALTSILLKCGQWLLLVAQG